MAVGALPGEMVRRRFTAVTGLAVRVTAVVKRRAFPAGG